MLESRCVMASDFGDAPDTGLGVGVSNYETLLANGGASHVIDTTQSSLFLGQRVDSEADGIPGTHANGDDLYTTPSSDDEDGVIDPNVDLVLTAGASPSVRLRATNTTGADATLYGWIDANRDGIFNNATERASINVPTASNNQVFTLNFPLFPLSAVGGKTYARFRLSADVAAANPNGVATGGEVEDYPALMTRISTGHLDTSKITKIADSLLGGPVLQNTDFFGSAVATLGDLDGSGRNFVAVGAPGRDGIGTDSGIVYLTPIQTNGTAGTSIILTPGVGGVPSYLAGDRFGSSLAAIGDVNGDGIPDLAVGAPGDDTGGSDRGAIYILRMNSDGTVKSSTKIASGTLNASVILNGDAFGSSIAGIPDLDGDGIAELAVGSSLSDTAGTDRGSVTLLFMNSDGTIKQNTVIASGIGGGPTLANNDHFGTSIASIGDLNGDGVGDIAIGSPKDTLGGFDTGAFYVLFLDTTGAATSFTKIGDGINGAPSDIGPFNRFGSSIVAAGDLDGDGIPDLSVGSTDYFSSGAIYHLMMKSDGTVKAWRSLNSFTLTGLTLNFGDDFAASVTVVGDLDGDGVQELVIGTPGEDNNGTDRGGLRIISLRADNVSPLLTIARQNPTSVTTNSDTLTFRLSFDEDAFNIDSSDFAVTGTTAPIQSVTLVGTNAYDVVVSGGDLASLNGTVGLTVATGRNIVDRVGNLLASGAPSTNNSYAIDNTAPVTTSFTRLIPNVAPTSADNVRFRATFNETVTNVDASDFIATGTTASITVTGSGSVYDLTLAGGDLATLAGTVGINFSPTQNITDSATNSLPTIEPSIDETFSIIQSTTDFGDAPDTGIGTGVGNYQTSLADNGPRHTIVAGLRLGSNIDAEPDGLTLDDGPNISPAPDDEDALIENASVWSITVGSAPSLRIRATNTTSSAATLYGWIDINRNGVFDNVTERASVTVPSGSNNVVVTLNLPLIAAGVASGNMQLRLRLSTDTAASSPIGLAIDGEVEDHIIRLVRPTDNTADASKSRELESSTNGAPALSSSDNYGSAVAALGDVNNDGIVDLAVGVRREDLSFGFDDGIIVIQRMNSNGTSSGSSLINSSSNSTSSDFEGTSLASLGDFNSDGVGDYVSGAPGSNIGGTDRGSIYVSLVNAGGQSASRLQIANAQNGGPTLVNSDFFGTSVSSIGDFDGDGITDIAVGAVGDDTGGTDRGAVYLLMLNANRTVKSTVKIASGLNGGPTLTNSSRFGSSIANIGDLDRDGVTDIAVGASLDDTGGTDRGAIFILFLNSNGSVKGSTTIASNVNGGPTLVNSDQFGYSATGVGDLNGDNIPDLIVGAPLDNTGLTDAGAIYVLNLNTNGSVSNSTKIARSTNGGPASLASGDRFGTSIASMGDLDGDGMIDLAVGAEGNDSTSTDQGSVHTVFLKRDLNAPSIASFTRQSPTTSPTNSDTLTFRVTFNEDALNVSADDFAVTGSSATVTSVSAISARVYDLVVTGGDLGNLNGSVGIDLSFTANIVDRSNNLIVMVEPSIDETYLVDNAGPQLVSFVRMIPSTNPTSADVLQFRATFNEAATGVDAADFVAVGASAFIAVSPVSSTVYDVTLSGGNLAYASGNIGLNVASGVTILDALGNSTTPVEPPVDEVFNLVFYGTDFGDAPDGSVGTGTGNYRTNLDDNGPRHTTVPGLLIGSFIDDEPNGQVSDDALETTLVNDDEDGLFASTDLVLTQGMSSVVRIQATNQGSTQATLYGWIDLNRDGVFDNASERASIVVPAGSTNQTFSLAFGIIPYGASAGATFARFRLSTDVAAADSLGLASDGEVEDYPATIATAPPTVVDRRVFYNRSKSSVFGDGTGNPTTAIDLTKTALLPGQTTSFANYTNYSRGLNGLIVDIANVGGVVTVADFQFATWDGIAASGFISTAAVPTITTIPNGGGNNVTRVKIEFDDNAIRNTWLRVQLLANANTGLAANDVFYFGNAVGDMNVGNTGSPIIVQTNESDVAAVRQNLSLGANSVTVSNIFDLNKDGRVNAIDTSLTMQSRSSRSIRHFIAPASLRSAIKSTLSMPLKTVSLVLAAGYGTANTQDKRPDAGTYGSGALIVLPTVMSSFTTRPSAPLLAIASANLGPAMSPKKPPIEVSTKELSSDWIQRIDSFFACSEPWK